MRFTTWIFFSKPDDVREKTEEYLESKDEIPSKEEREHLAQEYHKERALLEKALKTSTPQQEQSTTSFVGGIKFPEKRFSITTDPISAEERVSIPIDPISAEEPSQSKQNV